MPGGSYEDPGWWRRSDAPRTTLTALRFLYLGLGLSLLMLLVPVLYGIFERPGRARISVTAAAVVIAVVGVLSAANSERLRRTPLGATDEEVRKNYRRIFMKRFSTTMNVVVVSVVAFFLTR